MMCTIPLNCSRSPEPGVWGQVGFDDQARLEVAHVVGMFNHLTRLADGLGLALDEETLHASETGSALTRVGGE